MKKSKIISLVMAVTTLFSVSTPVYAVEAAPYDYSVMPISEMYDDLLISPRPATIPVTRPNTISVVLNGKTIDFTDENGNKVDPVLINDRTMVPLRKIFETLGATIEWDGATETVTAMAGDKVIRLQINNSMAAVTTGGANEIIKLDSAPVVIEGRTLVPVRFISETLGLKVGWDEETQSVIIIDADFIVEAIKKEAPTFYAFATEKGAEIKTAEMDYDVDGSIKYTHATDKTQNSDVKFAANILMKIAEKKVGMDLDYNLTGMGEIYDAFKDSGLEKATMNVVVDIEEPAAYLKSSLIEEEVGNKWVKEIYDPSELGDLSALEQVENAESSDEALKQAINILLGYIELTPETYDEIKTILPIACKLLSDEYFTVSGRATKVYKYEISIEDVEDVLSDAGMELGLPSMLPNTKLEFISIHKNGINTEATLDFVGNLSADDELLNLNLKAKGTMDKVNQEVTVVVPAADDVIMMDDVVIE